MKRESRLISIFLVTGLIASGLAARLALSAVSIGTNDAVNWNTSAHIVLSRGLSEAYGIDRFMTNPPLISLGIACIAALSSFLQFSFFFLLRLPGIAAEIGSAALVFLIWRRRDPARAPLATALFAWGLCSIVVTGFRGNTDGICAFFAFLAAYLHVERDEPFWSGASLGAAINVKLIPVLLIPAFLLHAYRSGRMWPFVAALAITSVPILSAVFLIGDPFTEKVLGYRSILDYWGVQTLFLLAAGTFSSMQDVFMKVSSYYHQIGPVLILAVISLHACICRARLNLYESCVAAFVLFSILASGFGLSYFAVFLPFLFAVSPRWAFRLSTAVGLTLVIAASFFLVQLLPLQSYHYRTLPKPAIFFSFLCWAGAIWFFMEYFLLRESSRESQL